MTEDVAESPRDNLAADHGASDRAGAHSIDALEQPVPWHRRISGTARANARAVVVDLRSFDGLMLLVAVVLCAVPNSIVPASGLDASWITALNLARQEHLHFGTELLFTYGPWGYLDNPQAVSRFNLITGIAFAIFALIVAWYALRRTFSVLISPALAAIAASAVLVIAMPGGGASAILVLGVGLALLNYVGSAEPGAPGWVPLGASACAAFLIEVKASEGLFLTVCVAAACVLGPARRLIRTAEAAVCFVVVLVVAWLLALQSLSDFPRWLDKTIEISRGYTEAMATDYKPHQLAYGLIILVIVAVVVYSVKLAWTRDFRRALGVFIVSASLVYLGFREGTTRHDEGHEVFFYLWALPALLWFIAIGRSRIFRSALLVLAVVLASNNWLDTNPQVVRARWSSTVEVLADGGYQHSYLEAAKNTAQETYDVSIPMRLSLAGQPMAVDGYESNVAWAYEFDWRPAPIFQSYAAFTADLDQINADWLKDAPANQMILRPPNTAIDYRNTLWDPPRYVLAEMCDLRVDSSDAKWLLLRKSSDRCSSANSISTQRVGVGQTISVPQVGQSQILTMSFTADSPGLASKLRTTIDKNFSSLNVTTDQGSYRLPRALATGPLIVSVPTTIGWPAAFAGDTSYHTVSFTAPGTVTFQTVDVSS